MISESSLVGNVSRYLDYVSRLVIVIMMLLSVGNILGSLLWKPIFGTYELVSFLTVLALSFSIPYCQVKDTHVSVSFVTDLLPIRVQRALTLFNKCVGAVLFLILGWRSVLYAADLWRKSEVSGTLQLPIFPFVLAVSLGCILLALVLVANLIAFGKKES